MRGVAVAKAIRARPADADPLVSALARTGYLTLRGLVAPASIA